MKTKTQRPVPAAVLESQEAVVSPVPSGAATFSVVFQLGAPPPALTALLSEDPLPLGARFLEICACLPAIHIVGAVIAPDAPDYANVFLSTPPNVTVRRVQRALGALFTDGPTDERERFQQMEEQTGTTPFIEPFHEVLLWRASFLAWGMYLEKGEQVLFAQLPHLFGYNNDFFLRQWWIAKVFGTWLSQGKPEKILRAMCGGPPKKKKVNPRFSTVIENSQRNSKIYERMVALGEQGVGRNAAAKQVLQEIQRGTLNLEGGFPLGISGIKKAFRDVSKKLSVVAPWNNPRKRPKKLDI